MKRAGFTMIELIFVIVILGILASVAVPKLIGVKASAEEGTIKAFVGTLNRTIGPSKWSQAMMDGNASTLGGAYNVTTADTDFPSTFTTPVVNLALCQVSDNNTSLTTPAITAKIGTKYYHILCRDGDDTQAPKFFYQESTSATAGTAALFPTNGNLKF